MSALDDLQKALNEFIADYAKDSSACQLLSYSNGVQEGKRVEIEARQLAEKRQFATAASLDSCQLEVRELKETLQEFREGAARNAAMLGDLQHQLTTVTGERDTVRSTVAQLQAELLLQVANLKKEVAKDFVAKNREITNQRQQILRLEAQLVERRDDIRELATSYMAADKELIKALHMLGDTNEKNMNLAASLMTATSELGQAGVERDAAVRKFEEGEHRVKRYQTAHAAITEAKERAEADFAAATLLAEDRQAQVEDYRADNELLRRELQDALELSTRQGSRIYQLVAANKELKTYAGVMETRMAAAILERDKGQLK